MSRPDQPSALGDGFAAIFHEPVLLAAELVWRWSFGLSALLLGLVSIGLFLDSLKLSRADEFLLDTLRPQLLEAAFRHIFRGSLSRFLLEQAVLMFGLVLLWSFAATAGRTAILRRLLAMFRREEAASPLEWHFLPVLQLNLLRTLWSGIALLVTTGLFAYGILMMVNEHALRAAATLSFGVGLAGVAGAALHWQLALACIFCVRNRVDAMTALDQALGFSSRHFGSLALLVLGYLTIRLLWAATLCLAFLAPLNLLPQIGSHWVLLLMLLVTLVYFAGADLLRLARLASYVSLIEDDYPATSLPELTAPADLKLL